MRISVTELAALQYPTHVIIHSLDRSLYQVEVSLDGQSRRLVDEAGKTLRWRSLAAAREALRGMPVAKLSLHHVSAYDEMVGQPAKVQSNLLAVSLSTEY
jgi:Family of unknown function (DUF6482)